MVSRHCVEIKKSRRDNDDDENDADYDDDDDDDNDDDDDHNNNNNNNKYTTGIIKKITQNLKLLNLHPALYILKQKVVIINTCCIVRKLLA